VTRDRSIVSGINAVLVHDFAGGAK